MFKILFLAVFVSLLAVGAKGSPAPTCRALLETDKPESALALVENQDHIHRLISRSGLSRKEAIPLIKELISSGVFAGAYHEMAYIMVAHPGLAGHWDERQNVFNLSDFEARNWRKRDLRRIQNEVSQAPTAARAMGTNMAELILELIDRAAKPADRYFDVVTSYGYNKTDFNDRISLYIGEESRANLRKLIPLLERPQARQLLRELYENSVTDIARYTYSRSGGAISKLAHGLIIAPVAVGTVALGLGSVIGMGWGVIDGSWEIGLSGSAAFGAFNLIAANGEKISNGVNKLINVPRLWLSQRNRNRLGQILLAPPKKAELSDKMKELMAPYEPFQTELRYQSARNLEHDFSSDDTITASSLAEIKKAADSQIYVAGVAVNQLRRESIYAERMLQLSSEFLETGFLAGSEVTPHEVDERWSQARTLRLKLEKMQDDAEELLIELKERFAYVKSLRMKLENAKEKFDAQRIQSEIENLRKAEDEIAFYLERFKKQRLEELNPALGRLEDTLRDGLLPIRSANQ